MRDKHIQGSPFKVNVVNTGEAYLKFGKKGTEIGEFNGIFGVAVDDEGRIIITDCHNHRVQVFNQNGGFMFHFGRKGEGSGQFQCPTGVGVDPDGRIVVCERLGSRIQVGSEYCALQNSLKFICVLVKRNKTTPKSPTSQ